MNADALAGQGQTPMYIRVYVIKDLPSNEKMQ